MLKSATYDVHEEYCLNNTVVITVDTVHYLFCQTIF